MRKLTYTVGTFETEFNTLEGAKRFAARVKQPYTAHLTTVKEKNSSTPEQKAKRVAAIRNKRG